MKIGFDGKRAVCNNTGLGNYSRLVIDVLSEYYPDNEYRLYSPKIADNARLSPLLERSNVKLLAPKTATGRTFSGLWRISSGIVRDCAADGVELFHGLSNELPLAHIGVPAVVTIHDVIFLYYPHCYKAIDRKIYNYKFRKACERSSRIIAVSECTKKDIVKEYGVAAEKVDVVYQGCDESFRRQCTPQEIADVRRRYKLPDGDYILYVGTIEERKNALLAVKAMHSIPADVSLVLVGRETKYAQLIHEYVKKHNLEKRVHFRSIAFGDLPAAYQAARAFTYPSRYEGFGIPILEALCSRTPVVATTGSCLEEAGGEAAIYVHPDDVDALSESLKRAMTDEDLRSRMIAEGLAHAAKFSRRTMASGIMDVYRKVL